MATRKKQKVDFDDEDAVLADVAKALDIDPDELSIGEARGPSSFGVATVYEITVRGGHKEWNVVENEDAERELALAVVKQDLEEQPEIFEPNFIESHIDTDRLRSDLESDVRDMRIEDLESMDAEDFWREWERDGRALPEDAEPSEDEDDYGEQREPTHSEVEELAESHVEEQLKDPIAHLEDIYGREDAVKKAIEIAGIDVDAAAEEAVDTDGPPHFLSSYDGNSYTTPGGLVYWRVN